MILFNKRGSNALFIILEGIAFTVVLNLYNPFVQLFAKRMGAADIHIALLNAMPPLVAVFVLIPFGIVIDRLNRKKMTAIFLIFVNSLFYAAIALVPFIPHSVKVIAYVVLIGLMNWPGSLYLITWQSFYADNFKGTEANSVYSLRSKYSTFFGLVTVLLTGLILTEIPKTENERIIIYQLFYLACFLISLIQILFLSKVKQYTPADITEYTAHPVQTFGKADFKEMLGSRSFMIFCLCTFVFHMTWQMGWPLFFIYNADYAKLNELQFALISVASGLTSFLSYSVWNRLIEKKGSNLVIIFGTLGLASNPFFFTIHLSFYSIIFIYMISGAAVAAFTLALFCGLLETLPENKKTVYISFFNTLTNITGFIAPLIGVWIYEHTNIYLTFFIIGVLRVIASMLYAVRWWSSKRKIRLKQINNTNMEV